MKRSNLAFSLVLGLLPLSCSDSSSDNGNDASPPINLTGDCPENTQAISSDPLICKLSGTYTEDLTLTNDILWVLSGKVGVGNDNNDNTILTIEPGTKIVGSTGKDFLVVNRGSKIEAVGTKEAPIVFTSSKEEGQRNRGDWGGLILNGNAPINGCNASTELCQAEGEGNTGYYGGNNPEDSSGTLKYVRVEFAGYEITSDNELNGIAFQGVGSGTVVDYVQVHMNQDDGVEFFGGTVNIKHIVLTGNRDDSLDWVNGWHGKGQYIYVKQAADQANNGIEADNLKADFNALPRSNPTLANLTFLGSLTAAKGGNGLFFRRGTGVSIYNAIVSDFKGPCLRVDDKETFDIGLVKIYNTLLACESGTASVDGADLTAVFLGMPGNVANDSSIELATYSEPVVNGEALPTDSFFDLVNYRGAIENAANDWTAGWTTNENL